MKKKYKKKLPQTKILKKYQNKLYELQSRFWDEVQNLEIQMAKETKIKDICFFMVEGNYVGIGNFSKTIPLWQFINNSSFTNAKYIEK